MMFVFHQFFSWKLGGKPRTFSPLFQFEVKNSKESWKEVKKLWKFHHFFQSKMSEKQTTFFTVNCAGKFESTNQCNSEMCQKTPDFTDLSWLELTWVDFKWIKSSQVELSQVNCHFKSTYQVMTRLFESRQHYSYCPPKLRRPMFNSVGAAVLLYLCLCCIAVLSQ
jgi:hypothetical protein